MSKHARPPAPTSNRNLMPVMFITVGVLLLVAVVWLLTSQPNTTTGAAIEVTGRPSLKVDQTVVDFGAVRLGETVVATFLVTNVGDQPLRFTEAPWTELVEGC